MTIKHAYPLGSIFALTMAAINTFSPPQVMANQFEVATSTQSVAQAMAVYAKDSTTQACMAERKRILYDARENVIILSHELACARQEIPDGPKL